MVAVIGVALALLGILALVGAWLWAVLWMVERCDEDAETSWG